VTTGWAFDEDETSRILPLEGIHHFRNARDYLTRDGRNIGPHQLSLFKS
jgi:hypothetical protein